ncbi:transposable element Tcb1 transposase [Trichonephila clavipes]|nr:transposable element Tcb1 transposase [Trichonephila clavipes]
MELMHFGVTNSVFQDGSRTFLVVTPKLLPSNRGRDSLRYLRLGDFDDFKFGNCVFLVVFPKNDQLCLVESSDQLLIKYPEFNRGRIVAYRDCGLSFGEIGSRVGRNQSTVMRICDFCMQDGTTDQRSRSHPPPCTTSREDRRPFLGLPLTQDHRRLRRQWCDERRMWVAEWNEVVFTDESRICLQHHDGQIRVWRHRRERMLNSCVMHRHTDSVSGIMVWSGIGYHSRTPLVRIAGTLNSQRYISEIELLPWPAHSPDLSPIENMWSMVAQRLTQITPPAATPDQLWQRVEAAWSAVPQEHIQSIFESMPKRVAAKDISYPTIIRSAIRSVPHGPDLPIPSPPDTLDNILDQISPIRSDSDDGYDPGTNDPELFSQSDLNDLVRDLGLPKDTAEVLGSRLKERYLLNSGVSFSWSTKGYTKFPCFLCEWDSRDRKQHYVKQTCPIRKALIPGIKNVERQNLVDPKKILFPPLHIKLGLMKQFVKALDKEECSKYLCEQFPGLSDAKLKETIFVGPDIRKLLKDETFVTKMEMKEKNAWNSFKLVVTGFFGNKKDPNYKALVAELLQNYKILGCNMSV